MPRSSCYRGYPAVIHQKLKGGRYDIVRKLGYGSRSSTWLVSDNHNVYSAVKILTISASERAKTIELPLFKAIGKLDDSYLSVPRYKASFWEEGVAGNGPHLCLVMTPLSTSVRALQLDSDNQRLPLFATQRIVGTVAHALRALHASGIMHGAVKLENILFFTSGQSEALKHTLESDPAPKTTKIKKHLTVQSQPLAHSWRWKDKPRKVADWAVYLTNFGHAQQGNFTPEKDCDYLSAPETLLQDATCSLQTDIWMLGHLAFDLLTGIALFAKGNAAKRIATMSAILEDEVPKSWLRDKKMKEYSAISNELVTSIEARLLAVPMPKDDASAASELIKACLRLDPTKRLTAMQATKHSWLAKSNICSCCA